jgi:hypothetical protein
MSSDFAPHSIDSMPEDLLVCDGAAGGKHATRMSALEQST